MIKIVARVTLENGKKTTRSFQSKENRIITKEDLSNIWSFVNLSLINGYKPQIKWKITYDTTNKDLIFTDMSGKFTIINQERGTRLIENMLMKLNSKQ